MESANQQKIISYFIEEAKEHLQNIEQGILALSTVSENTERVNELFRAAHSVKGGAAMLGFGSIQKTAHRLEDAFKILKDNPINVDQKLESLFFESYDVLQDLVLRLQGPYGLPDDEGDKITEKAQPIFAELQSYLNDLLNGTVSGPVSKPVIVSPSEEPEQLQEATLDLLKQLLQLFKQSESSQTRQQMQQLCTKLAKLAPQNTHWQVLLQTAKEAIANPKHSFRTLAPVIIKELKQGSDYLALGVSQRIIPSPVMKTLAVAKLPQILVSLDPVSAAKTLKEAFNQPQLTQFIQALQSKD